MTRDQVAAFMYTAWVNEHGYPNGLHTWDELPKESTSKRAANLHCKDTWLSMADFCNAALPQWQPIETAPKDGTLILIWDDQVIESEWSSDCECWSWAGASRYGPPEPTHWMPLPPLPQQENSDGG